MKLSTLINESKKQIKLVESELTEPEILKIFQDLVDSPENKTGNLDLPQEAKKLIDSKVLEMGKILHNTNPIANLEATFAGLRSTVTKRLTGNKNAGIIIENIKNYIKWATADASKSEFVKQMITELIYILDDKDFGQVLADYYLVSLSNLMNYLRKKSSTQNESLIESIIDDVKGLLTNVGKTTTVDQLKDDWEKAGKPTDATAIAAVLDDYFDMHIINKYMKVEEPIINLGLNDTTETTETIDKEVQDILTFIKKSKLTNEQVIGVLKGLNK